MKKLSGFIPLLVVLIFAASSLVLLSFDKTPQAKVYEPTKDFKFLNQEWVLSRCLTMSHWETNPDLTFDSAGIIMNKKAYHPVVVSQYALTCFDAYMKTKDERIKVKFLNQVKYLKAVNLYKQISDDVVAYPYTTNFHDLVAPWYSGLAQAEVLGVLVRYYYLTNDKAVLPLMVKIKNMITLPVSKGGLLDTTPQGCVWIEEYPKSKQHAHVINGFMVTLLLLDDYCKFFPGDTETRKLVDDCFVSLKESVTYYDTGSWLKYDRGTSAQTVNNWYMKAQVKEADQLYLITKDEFFKKTSLLWGTYCYNKVIGYKGCIIDSVNYSVPVTLTVEGSLNIQSKFTNGLNAESVKRLSINRCDTISTASRLTDHNDNTMARIKFEKNQAEQPIIEITFDDVINAQQIVLVAAANLTGDKVSFTYQSDRKSKWKNLVVSSEEFINKNSKFIVDLKNANALRITFTKMKENEFIDLGEIKLNISGGKEESEYMHYQTPDMKLNTGHEKFVFDNVPSTEYAVFYKTAPTTDALKKLKFNADSATFNSLPQINAKGNFASFLLVIKRTPQANNIRNIRLESLAQ